jgi:hypothetical protein
VTLETPYSVRIVKIGSDLGDAMNAIREWLDSRKIEPIEFKTLPVDGGGIVLNICFRYEDEAHLFELAFS